MVKHVKKTLQEKVKLIGESKVNGAIETARKYDLHYQTLKNWVDVHALHGVDGLDKKVVRTSPELKRMLVENGQLKVMLAEKELEIRIKNDLPKKTQYKPRQKNDSYQLYRTMS